MKLGPFIASLVTTELFKIGPLSTFYKTDGDRDTVQDKHKSTSGTNVVLDNLYKNDFDTIVKHSTSGDSNKRVLRKILEIINEGITEINNEFHLSKRTIQIAILENQFVYPLPKNCIKVSSIRDSSGNNVEINNYTGNLMSKPGVYVEHINSSSESYMRIYTSNLSSTRFQENLDKLPNYIKEDYENDEMAKLEDSRSYITVTYIRSPILIDYRILEKKGNSSSGYTKEKNDWDNEQGDKIEEIEQPDWIRIANAFNDLQTKLTEVSLEWTNFKGKLSSEPDSPQENDWYFKHTDKRFYKYTSDGSWQKLSFTPQLNPYSLKSQYGRPLLELMYKEFIVGYQREYGEDDYPLSYDDFKKNNAIVPLNEIFINALRNYVGYKGQVGIDGALKSDSSTYYTRYMQTIAKIKLLGNFNRQEMDRTEVENRHGF